MIKDRYAFMCFICDSEENLLFTNKFTESGMVVKMCKNCSDGTNDDISELTKNKLWLDINNCLYDDFLDKEEEIACQNCDNYPFKIKHYLKVEDINKLVRLLKEYRRFGEK